jgi:hypothetical protein
VSGLLRVSAGFLYLIPQKPAPVPFPRTDAIKDRLNSRDCNAYIASLLAKTSESHGRSGNVAVAKGVGRVKRNHASRLPQTWERFQQETKHRIARPSDFSLSADQSVPTKMAISTVMVSTTISQSSW